MSKVAEPNSPPGWSVTYTWVKGMVKEKFWKDETHPYMRQGGDNYDDGNDYEDDGVDDNDDDDVDGNGDIDVDDNDDDKAYRCHPGGSEGGTEEKHCKWFQLCRQNKEHL